MDDRTMYPTHPTVVAAGIRRLAAEYGEDYVFSLTDEGVVWALLHDDPTVGTLNDGDGVAVADYDALEAAVRSVRGTDEEGAG